MAKCDELNIPDTIGHLVINQCPVGSIRHEDFDNFCNKLEKLLNTYVKKL